MKKIFVLFVLVQFYIFSFAQWQQTNGPYGGIINCFLKNGTNIFAGTTGGKLFLSTDNGVSWTFSSNGLNNRAVRFLAIKNQNIYAGTDGGVYLSLNNGVNWTVINEGLTDTIIRALIVHNSNLYVGTRDSGIFISTNNGVSWTASNNGLSDYQIRCLKESGNNIFASTYLGGVFLSTDNGINWTISNNGLSNNKITSIVTIDTIIFAGSYGGGVFKSINNGLIWTATNLINTSVMTLLSDGVNLYAGTVNDGLFKSTDNGINWLNINLSQENVPILTLNILDAKIFAGTWGGIFISTNNGTNWIASNTGLIATKIYSMENTGINLFASIPYEGLFSSIDNGLNWSLTNTVSISINSLTINGNNFIAKSSNNLILSTDNGANWLTIFGSADTSVNTFTINGANIFVGTNRGIFRTIDNGNSWSSANDGLNDTLISNLFVSGSTIFVTTTCSIGLNNFYKSTNNGLNWNLIDNTVMGSCIYQIYGYGNHIYVSNSNYEYFFSTNDGDSWLPVNNELSTIGISCWKEIGTNVIASTSVGMILTADNFTTIVDINSNLPKANIWSLTINGAYIYVGTDGRGVWKRPLSEIVNIEKVQENNEIKIYPNPTNEKIAITGLDIETVEIINVQGQIVKTFYTSETKIPIDISKLSSGVYTIKVKTENEIIVKKLIKN